MQSVIVLGGGMIGVSAALHLQQRGWTVTLVDRREPGRETSYGNAGMIQAEAVRPYPMPRDLATLLKIATGRTAPGRMVVTPVRRRRIERTRQLKPPGQAGRF